MPLAKYRWRITKDHISEGEAVGVEGPSNLDPDLSLKDGQRFRMDDDDGEVYYYGVIAGDYDGFEPLDDFGTGNAGCTSIWYWEVADGAEKGEWAVL